LKTDQSENVAAKRWSSSITDTLPINSEVEMLDCTPENGIDEDDEFIDNAHDNN